MKIEIKFLWILLLVPVIGQAIELSEEPIVPIPVGQIKDMDKSQLGRLLFEDKSLSRNNTISCSSCHNLQKGGVDGLRTSIGINQSKGLINAPTVFNSSLSFRQFWNGRAKSLVEQVEEPIHNPKEMGSTWNEVVTRLSNNPKYQSMFWKIYKEPVSQKNITDALVAFENALTTPNSRFDRYLKGENKILSEIEIRGYQKFKSFGCIACHQGVNVGGNMYQTMGVMGNYFKDRKTPLTSADLGLYEVTKQTSDKHVFKVPTLRNIAQTAPYFHDGSTNKLEEAVKIMGKYQLGLSLSNQDVESIVAFLKTLSGETPLILMEQNKQ